MIEHEDSFPWAYNVSEWANVASVGMLLMKPASADANDKTLAHLIAHAQGNLHSPRINKWENMNESERKFSPEGPKLSFFFSFLWSWQGEWRKMQEKRKIKINMKFHFIKN
jgi:hypothetical protein